MLLHKPSMLFVGTCPMVSTLLALSWPSDHICTAASCCRPWPPSSMPLSWQQCRAMGNGQSMGPGLPPAELFAVCCMLLAACCLLLAACCLLLAVRHADTGCILQGPVVD